MNKFLKMTYIGILFGFFFLLYPIAILICYKKHYWIISERHNDARDNGFFFFRYLNEKHKEINSAYLIDFDSPDFHKVNSLGKTIKYGSLKHWLLFISADVRASTHLGAIAPNKWIGRYFELHKCWHGINVFLQHGVIKEYLDMAIYEENHVDAFICGAKPEYDFLVKEYPAPKNTFVYTGLARFDNLHVFKAKKQILFMPTWRLYLAGSTDIEFSKCDYFLNWNRLINDNRLADLLIKNNIELIFYPHYSTQPYIHLFKTNCRNIKIADFNHYDVPTLLKESSLLVTDYSSIFFDFAYMKKPLIYYQFDQTDYFTKHYHRGYFLHERDGFGPVVYDNDSVIECINKFICQDFKNDDIYIKRSETFFPLYDRNNCERIYQTCLNKLQERKQ